MGKIGWMAWLAALSILNGQMEYTDWDGMSVLPADLESPMKMTITLGGTDITEASREDIWSAVENTLAKQRAQLVKIQCGDATFEKSRYELGLHLARDREWILSDIERFRESYLLMELNSGGDLATAYEYVLPLAYEDGLVDKWVRSVKKRVDDPMIEHGLILKDGQFVETEGQSGMEVSREVLKRELADSLLAAASDEPYIIEAARKEVFPIRDRELLKTVDARIAGFSSYFPLYQEGRTENVRTAAQKVDRTILMPGDEFSFAEKVSPVNSASGYHYATIFMNGQPVSGIGGGICQVSSTMYNTQLKAGIKATARMNHSLIVDYVPRGQDATMAEGFIDYKFVNTLDYPIYIHATTYGGTLTVEFWSNREALNGIAYLPRTVFKGLTEDGRRKYDTTLYGYNKNGELVYEEFLHRSFYLQKG